VVLQNKQVRKQETRMFLKDAVVFDMIFFLVEHNTIKSIAKVNHAGKSAVGNFY